MSSEPFSLYLDHLHTAASVVWCITFIIFGFCNLPCMSDYDTLGLVCGLLGLLAVRVTSNSYNACTVFRLTGLSFSEISSTYKRSEFYSMDLSGIFSMIFISESSTFYFGLRKFIHALNQFMFIFIIYFIILDFQNL